MRDMPIEMVKRLLDEAATWRPKPAVQFSGFGEPTLYPHLVEAVQHCTRKGMRSRFYSNGMMLTPSLTKELVQAGLTWFLVTIDARDKETYESIRVGLDFETVEYNVKEAWKICRKSGTRMEIGAVKCKENKDDIANIKKYWEKHSEVYTIIGEIPLVEGRIKYHPANYCRKKPWTQLLVRANGDVPFCCIDVEDKYTNIGNVNNQTMLEIYNSTEVRNLRHNIEQGKNLPPMCRRICFSR